MAKPKTRPQVHRPVGRTRNNSNPKKGLLIAIIAAVLLAAAGVMVWMMADCPPTFKRAALDRYVEAQSVDEKLHDGAAIYIDVSDGMLCAYKEEAPKKVLKSMINKMAANDAIEFFTLSRGKIELCDMSHTELFNYFSNDANYEKKWSAPIEETLKTIIEREQPAILISDFEEYNDGQIQRAAYAKRYFINWLEKGYNITFYTWDFIENDINKSMFIAVFDDNNKRLEGLVSTAIDSYFSDEDKFVLAGSKFAFPTFVSYNTINEGGVYRIDGKDLVTNLMAEGGSEDYCCYASPKATPSGKGIYSELNQLVGDLAEYYPFGLSWESAIKNIKDYKGKFKHLLQGLYVDLNAQDGYNIEDVELRVFNISPILDKVADKIEKKQPITIDDINEWDIDGAEVFDMLRVSIGESDFGDGNPIPLCVDVNKQFTGVFNGNVKTGDVLRANIVIADVTVNYDLVEEYFAWDGNTCLSDSVKEALDASSSSPIGKIIYTYYFKACEE